MSWTTINRNFMSHIRSCEHSDKEMLANFIKANGFTKMTNYETGWNIKKVLSEGGHIGVYQKWGDMPPFLDHSQYFKNVETGVCCFTYNTYENIDKVKAALTDWSAKNGLAFEVYEPEHSWYYPDNTCFVVIHLPNDVIKLK